MYDWHETHPELGSLKEITVAEVETILPPGSTFYMTREHLGRPEGVTGPHIVGRYGTEDDGSKYLQFGAPENEDIPVNAVRCGRCLALFTDYRKAFRFLEACLDAYARDEAWRAEYARLCTLQERLRNVEGKNGHVI